MWVAYLVLLAAALGFAAGFLANYRTGLSRRINAAVCWWRARRGTTQIMARTSLDLVVEQILDWAVCEKPGNYDTSRWLVVVEEFRGELGDQR